MDDLPGASCRILYCEHGLVLGSRQALTKEQRLKAESGDLNLFSG